MIRTHKLGNSDLDVSVLGLGCMGMSEFYGNADETESVRVLHRALELGMNFFDTADMYGPFRNEELLSRAMADRWDQVRKIPQGHALPSGRLVLRDGRLGEHS